MVPEFIFSEPSLLDDPLEKPPRKLSAMHRHDCGSSRCGISQSDMAAFLAFKMEACALQCSDDFLSRHARQPCEHTSGNDRSTNRDAQRHGLFYHLILGKRITVCGERFEIQFKRLFGVANGCFVRPAPCVTAEQSWEMSKVSVFLTLDR
jgi:hypothetical protein